LLALDKAERNRVLDTLKKLLKLDWEQAYRDQGLKWEKITGAKPLTGIDVLYSLLITQSRRLTAIRDGDFMRFRTVHPIMIPHTVRNSVNQVSTA
jgi:hypothetical protein